MSDAPQPLEGGVTLSSLQGLGDVGKTTLALDDTRQPYGRDMGAPGGDPMAGMAERDSECFLCLRQFTAMYGDYIIAEEIICDDRLAELGS
jgi:hypothetical protein